MKNMKEQYLINYISSQNESVWIFPDPEEKIDHIINSIVPSDSKYLLTKENLQSFNFLSAYICDFSLPSGSYSPILFDIERAKTIFISYLRSARDPLLKDLDVQFMIALEIGDTIKTQEIGTKKQELRDITAMDLSSATDLDSLKLLWPTSILGNCPF